VEIAPIDILLTKVVALEAAISQLLKEKAIKEFYTTGEVAEKMNKAEFTVREWCRLGRIHAEKRTCGRGTAREWMISHSEFVRLQSYGLLSLGPKKLTR
jgi:hypothetical protein